MKEAQNQRNEKIYDLVFGRLKRRTLADCAIGICDEDCVFSSTYPRIRDDTTALACLVAEAEAEQIFLCGGNAIQVALAILVASLLSLPLTLAHCEAEGDRPTPFKRSDGRILVIAPSSYLKLCDKQDTFIDLNGFSAAVEGARSRSDPHTAKCGKGFSLTFAASESNGTTACECYDESSLIFSARAFAELSSLSTGEVTLCDLSPTTPSGAVCGLLSCLLSGGYFVSCPPPCRVSEYCPTVRPHRLLCTRAGAYEASALLQDGCSPSLPIPFTPMRREWRRITRLRRLASSRLMLLGGELRQVTLLGGAPPYIVSIFASSGVLCDSLLSCPSCPTAALRSYLTDRFWRVPNGILADMCAVESGGRGIITLSGHGISMPPQRSDIGGRTPGCFRSDEWQGVALVTDLYGFVTPKGQISVEKRLKNEDFFKKLNNYREIVL